VKRTDKKRPFGDLRKLPHSQKAPEEAVPWVLVKGKKRWERAREGKGREKRGVWIERKE
jgi:hypothetical protein